MKRKKWGKKMPIIVSQWKKEENEKTKYLEREAFCFWKPADRDFEKKIDAKIKILSGLPMRWVEQHYASD